MAGHSKWANIKHRKGAADAKRSKVFTKLLKEIAVAVKMGGGDPSANPRLRLAVSNARSQEVPKDNIERAIKRASGDSDQVDYQELLYEGHGPTNIAVIVEVTTDNKNRSSANVRSIFNKSGGGLGAVQYLFDQKGLIEVSRSAIAEDTLLEWVLEWEAEDLNTENDDVYEVITSRESFLNIRNQLEEKEILMSRAELAWVAQSQLEVSSLADAQKIIRFLDTLEDDDDVQKVHSNVVFSDEVMQQLQADQAE